MRISNYRNAYRFLAFVYVHADEIYTACCTSVRGGGKSISLHVPNLSLQSLGSRWPRPPDLVGTMVLIKMSGSPAGSKSECLGSSGNSVDHKNGRMRWICLAPKESHRSCHCCRPPLPVEHVRPALGHDAVLAGGRGGHHRGHPVQRVQGLCPDRDRGHAGDQGGGHSRRVKKWESRPCAASTYPALTRG